MNARAHLYISGRVQGVNYRWFTSEVAHASGLAGWVRNLPDTRVEAVFEGEEHSVKMLVNYCRQGPPAARVSNLNVSYGPFKGEFPSFNVL